MSFKTFLLGLALGGVAMNLYAQARPARGDATRRPVDPDDWASGDMIDSDLGSGAGRTAPVGQPLVQGRTDDLLSPGTTSPATTTGSEASPEATVAERF